MKEENPLQIFHDQLICHDGKKGNEARSDWNVKIFNFIEHVMTMDRIININSIFTEKQEAYRSKLIETLKEIAACQNFKTFYLEMSNDFQKIRKIERDINFIRTKK